MRILKNFIGRSIIIFMQKNEISWWDVEEIMGGNLFNCSEHSPRGIFVHPQGKKRKVWEDNKGG